MLRSVSIVGVLALLLPGLLRAQLTPDDEVAMLVLAVREAVGQAPFTLARAWGEAPGCPGQAAPIACVVEATTRIGLRPPSPAQQVGFTDALARARLMAAADSLLPTALWQTLSRPGPAHARDSAGRARCRVLAVSRVTVDATGQFAVSGYALRQGGAVATSCGGNGYSESAGFLFQRTPDGRWTRAGMLAGSYGDVFAAPRRRTRGDVLY